MNEALRKLVHRELAEVGIKAQDLIKDENAFSRVNTELNKAWDHCRAGDLESAAKIALWMGVETDEIIKEEKRGAGR
jgi:hypothetical protein